MDSIDSNLGMGPEMYAIKKAIQTQEQGLMKLLDSTQAPAVTESSSSPSMGLGQTLDIRG